MKIAVFGATGPTGRQAVKQALAANHSVTAIVRKRAKIDLKHENLKVEEGDIFNVVDLTERLTGHDAVIACLGFLPDNPKPSQYLEAVKNICYAMEACGLKKLVICHSGYTDEATRAKANFFLRCCLFPMIKNIYNSMRETEDWFDVECKLDFTVVRHSGGLTDGPVTDKPFRVEVGVFELAGARSSISRADVGRFMVSCANTEEYNRKYLAFTVYR